MANLDVSHEVLIEAPAEVVWRTITEPDEIARWFADRVELDLRLDGDGTLVFEDQDGTGTKVAPLVVVTVERPHRFSFRWSHPEGEVPGPRNSVLVEFTLVAEGSARTRLRVVETGLDEIGWPEDTQARYAADHRQGWAHHVGRLETLFPSPAA
jgi:uncharacterized protein YndB with AHSA1/START domain